MALKNILKILKGNKDVPKPVPVESEEYETIEITPEEDKEPLIIKKVEEEKPKEIIKEVVKEVKIPPKIYVVRIKHPLDFEEIKRKVDKYNIILINLEEAPEEAIAKELIDFKDYMVILGYKLGFIAENVILAYKDAEIDKYVSNIVNDAECVE
ncbi:hypothetical protein ACPB8Q_05395 [Methanocaldococcus indicus]|uniref:hypothetical protein n=1 Tax=Methanocaldococcus indicus TaxID=213231 RepID=UPI003C6D0EEE